MPRQNQARCWLYIVNELNATNSPLPLSTEMPLHLKKEALNRWIGRWVEGGSGIAHMPKGVTARIGQVEGECRAYTTYRPGVVDNNLEPVYGADNRRCAARTFVLDRQ
ncbi:hypothetical protein Cob_v006679 [Colletotrichum orbiculare MAFF 240422]|uniref:Uncharacterized protein n=1 Tax=Colletotrichum orbiculare (strain 104-T / ATCC 96160 / CBS 514.97 / LARS 414 / MAFF 240422) TaxID=1213857 RepID=A0A484FRQ1_COLOR|nr:hypothetical protein Cob_v006679 [Colletotrichum orbiculare MAFF 240422]